MCCQRLNRLHVALLPYILVASIIDIGFDSTTRIVDINGQESGYVVSHKKYGRRSYRGNTTSSLTLTGFSSTMLTIAAELFRLDCKGSLKCYDYLRIQGSKQLCKKRQFPLYIALRDDQISF